MSFSIKAEWTVPPTVLAENTRTWEQELQTQIRAIFRAIAGQAAAWMKANAPWNDQTGKARAGLQAITKFSTTNFLLTLMHTVFYGPYLEFGTHKMSPRPIIGPAQAEFGSQIMAAIHALGLS